MDASAWIALASLAVVIVAQAVVLAFALGGLFRDVKSLRDRPQAADCKAELAVLNAKFEGLRETLSDLAHDVKSLLTGRVVPARRRVGDDA